MYHMYVSCCFFLLFQILKVSSLVLEMLALGTFSCSFKYVYAHCFYSKAVLFFKTF